MKKTFISLALTLIFCALSLVLSTSYAARTATAAAVAQSHDPCVVCQGKVQRRLDKCEAKSGGPTQACYDEFNQGIVECYATVCEQ